MSPEPKLLIKSGMFQFSLFFIFAWGLSVPLARPLPTRSDVVPGTWVDLAPSIDETVFDLLEWRASFVNFSKRSLFLFYTLFFCFVVASSLATIVGLIPWLGAIVLFGCFGVVPVVTWAWTLLISSMIFVSSMSVVLYLIWIKVLTILFNLVNENGNEVHRAQLADTIRRSVASVSAADVEMNFKPVMVSGRVYSPSTLNRLMEDDLCLAGAIASYYLYCPVPVAGFSSTLASCLLLTLYLSSKLYSSIRRALKSVFWVSKMAFVLIWLAFQSNVRTLGIVMDVYTLVLSFLIHPLVFLFRHGGYRTLRAYLRLLSLILFLKFANLAFRVGLLTSKRQSDPIGFTSKKESLRSYWNNTIMDLTRLVDNIAIPNFVREIPTRFDREAINETNAILESLGWPKAPEVIDVPNEEIENFPLHSGFFLGNAQMRQGVLRLQLEVAKELDNLRGIAPEYKRTEQYATVESELESISRYFTTADVVLPSIHVDEVWTLIGDIFANSKLTPFSYILKKWEKKYGLSPFYGDPASKRKWKKLSRRNFIRKIGGMAEMVKLWAKTFEVSPGLIPVSGISVKGEALPPKKWTNGLVRTVVSSPLTHYIMSTIWNYAPNHNFKFWSTNIKVGLPLNGANISQLVVQHDGYHNHFAGDFTAFDSTVNKQVAEIVAAIRKKGFERHRDYAKICFLIDNNYRVLLQSPMLTTSTGNIYAKRGGLSTGHSSTSMDNSLAVTIYYLCAWKHLTGLSSHEFRFFNKLSNYGDDHLLSYLNNAPAAWTPENIIKAMKSFGVSLRDEEPSHDLLQMEFLSKRWRRPTSSDAAELTAAGIVPPALIVYHNPLKLVGKATAPSPDVRVDRNYRIKRLISYLYLCAHHKDIYDKLVYDIGLLRITNKGKQMPLPAPVPSYNDVLKSWYDPNSRIVEEDTAIEDEIIDYSMDGLFDTIANFVSIVPDVLNPTIYNMGYTNFLVASLAPYLTWPIELVRRSNSAVSAHHLVVTLKKTCYDFLADNPNIIMRNDISHDGALLMRHWLFLLFGGPALSPKLLGFLSFLDKKLGDFNFVVNGYVQTVQRRVDFPVLQIALVAALSFVPGPPIPHFVQYIRIPTFSQLIENAYGIVLNTFWSKVPANMKQANAAFNLLGPEQNAVLVEAPTGTGKSTTLVNFLYRYHSHRYQRFILVVPRHLLVVTLAPYLRQAFNLPAKEVTEGFPFDASYRFIVCTPQEFLLHEEWHTEGNLVQIDESHVLEPALKAVIRICAKLKISYVMTTATPSIENIESSNVHVPLQIASAWKVFDEGSTVVRLPDGSDYREYWQDYRTKAISLIRANQQSKILVFVVDNAHALQLASLCGRKSCVLSSAHKIVDHKAEVFIATAVADVGLTIPDVDWVITSNITRKAVPEGRSSKVVLCRATPALLRQRRGRTGRTNNGLFTCYSYVGLNLAEDSEWNDLQVGFSLLMSGASPSVVARYYPGAITSLWSMDYTRDSDAIIDEFVSKMDKFHSVMASQNQRAFKAAEDGVDYGNLWTVQGNVIPSAIPVYVNGVIQDSKPMTTDDMFRFMVAASKYLVDAKLEPSENDLLTYFRGRTVSGKSFKEVFQQGAKPYYQSQAQIGAPSVNTEPSGRFGKRTKVSRFDAVSDVVEGFDIDLS